MERGSGKNHSATSSSIHHHQRQRKERIELDTFTPRSSSSNNHLTTSTPAPDFVLQWGNKKRLRCMKIQTKIEPSGSALQTTARVDRRVVMGDFTKQQRPASLVRNSETMMDSSQGHGSNGKVEHLKLLYAQEGKSVGPASAPNNHRHKNDVYLLETAHEESIKKVIGGGGSSSGSEVIPPAAWPPTKFVIALTNKEKEEDFMAIKGSKLPQRPRKRSKYVQRNLKLVSPGAWLCELTLDRYEVREKKTSKKRPRGLKAMCNNVESEDSE